MWGFRGAFLTWAAVPGALALFAVMALAWGVGVSYHPYSPAAYQWPFLLVLVFVTLLALFALAVRHGAKARRALFWRNLGELGSVVAGFVLATGLVMTLVKGPKTLDRMLFGEVYAVPTAYRPTSPQDIRQGESLVIDVCKPDDAPVYATLNCYDQAQVRFGKEVLTDDFLIGLRLKEAGASHSDDTLHSLGSHRPGVEPNEIVYANINDELRLWLGDGQNVAIARYCDTTYGVDCTAFVHQAGWSVVFPVYDLQTTASQANLRQAAQTWLDRLESWRCSPSQPCD